MRYLVCIITASILFGISPSVQKEIMDSGLGSFAILLPQEILVCSLSLVLNYHKIEKLKLNRDQLAELFLLGGLCAATSLLLLGAYRSAPVGLVTTIHFIYPSFVCIAGLILFNERLRRLKVFAIIFSILGMACIAGESGSGSLAGVIPALLSGLTYAAYMLLVEHGRTRSLCDFARVFYSRAFSAMICLLLNFSVTVRELESCCSVYIVLLLLLNGLINFFACFLLVAGVSKIGAAQASFVSLLEPVVSLILSTLLYKYDFSFLQTIGCGLIVLSIVMISADKTGRQELRHCG